MKTAYLFDIDGTLTPPTQKMQGDFVYSFLDWSDKKDFFLVGGSSYDSIAKQLPFSIVSRASGIFSSMANELRIKDELIYKNKFDPPKTLIEMLSSFQINTKSPTLGEAPFFEYRTGMLNFTTVGRSIGLAQRNIYYEWDKKFKERTEIAKKVEETFSYLEAKLGGQISLDIQPKGKNKSQAIDWVRNLKEYNNLCYFGDKGFKGGNDYDAKMSLLNQKNDKFYQVKDCSHTKKILESIL
jgi:phosphomannomutase